MTTVWPQVHKVSHSLLFIRGKKEEATAFCKQLLEPLHHTKIDSNTHPDLHFYVPEGKSELHPIANIQKLICEMSYPPFEAPYKMFILEKAEKMFPSTANALLKVLEEPKEDTYFLLLSDFPDLLLPTIRSRLQPFSFSPKETPPYDLSPYFTLVQERRWGEVLQSLSALEEEDPQAILHGFLQAEKNPQNFSRLAESILQAQTALEHHVRPRTVYLHLLLQMI